MGERLAAEILSSDGINKEVLTNTLTTIISSGGVAVMKIDGPMYGFVFNAANSDLVARVWALKGRPWEAGTVRAEEKIAKPVTAVTKTRFQHFIDWQKVPYSYDHSIIQTLLTSGLHLVFPVTNVVPHHLITNNNHLPTLSMMVVDEQFPILGPAVCQLERSFPEIIVGGTSANITGSPVFTELAPLKEALGNNVDLIISDKDFKNELPNNRVAVQRGMVFVSEFGIRIIREGIGLGEAQRSIFPPELLELQR